MTELRGKLRPGPDSGAKPAAGQADQAEPIAAGATEPAEARKGGGGGPNGGAERLASMHSGAENFGLNDFALWETHLAARLGLSRRMVAELRLQHLQEGVHFVKNGSRLLYSEAGADKLAGLLANGSTAEKSRLANVLSEPNGVKKAFRFTVRRKATNTHVLECTDSAGTLVMVRVRDSAHFIPGMEVEAVPYGDLPHVYEFAGAYPRFRGKY